MNKMGKKHTPDPVKDQLLKTKQKWNKDVKALIDDMKAFKQLVNGYPNKFHQQKSRIIDPIPAEPAAILDNIASKYNEIAQVGKNIVQQQSAFSQKFKEKIPNKAAAYLLNEELVAEASNIFSRLWTKITNPTFGDSMETSIKRFRLAIIDGLADLFKKFKSFEKNIGGKILGIRTTPNLENLQKAQEIFTELMGDWQQLREAHANLYNLLSSEIFRAQYGIIPSTDLDPSEEKEEIPEQYRMGVTIPVSELFSQYPPNPTINILNPPPPNHLPGNFRDKENTSYYLQYKDVVENGVDVSTISSVTISNSAWRKYFDDPHVKLKVDMRRTLQELSNYVYYRICALNPRNTVYNPKGSFIGGLDPNLSPFIPISPPPTTSPAPSPGASTPTSGTPTPAAPGASTPASPAAGAPTPASPTTGSLPATISALEDLGYDYYGPYKNKPSSIPACYVYYGKYLIEDPSCAIGTPRTKPDDVPDGYEWLGPFNNNSFPIESDWSFIEPNSGEWYLIKPDSSSAGSPADDGVVTAEELMHTYLVKRGNVKITIPQDLIVRYQNSQLPPIFASKAILRSVSREILTISEKIRRGLDSCMDLYQENMEQGLLDKKDEQIIGSEVERSMLRRFEAISEYMNIIQNLMSTTVQKIINKLQASSKPGSTTSTEAPTLSPMPSAPREGKPGEPRSPRIGGGRSREPKPGSPKPPRIGGSGSPLNT